MTNRTGPQSSGQAHPNPLTPEVLAAGAANKIGTKPTVRRPTPAALADVALIDGPSIAAAACISVSQWHDLVRVGDAPQPVIRAPRCTRWRLSDARAWLVEFARTGMAANGEAVIAKASKASAAALDKRRAQKAQG